MVPIFVLVPIFFSASLSTGTASPANSLSHRDGGYSSAGEPRFRATTTSDSGHYPQPGCFLMGNTRLMKIPGCLPFNLTTNICRGFCMSYSIPATDDLAASFSDLSHDFSSYIDNVNMGTYMDKPTLVNDEDDSNDVGPSTSRNERSLVEGGPTDDARLASSDLYAAGRLALGQFEAERLQDAPSDHEPIDGEPTPQMVPARDVISVSQCCNMVDSDEYQMNVPCHDGQRRVSFKMAKSCECLFCKAH